MTASGIITTGKLNCTYFDNPTGTSRIWYGAPVPDLRDMGMAGSGGGTCYLYPPEGTKSGSGLTYTYNVSNAACGTWYCLDLDSNPLNGTTPAIGVSCNNTNNVPYANSALTYSSGANTSATLVFTGSGDLAHCYNTSGIETAYTYNSEVRITVTGAGGDGFWHNIGSQYFFEVPTNGTFSVKVLALADAYDWNGHMTGNNLEQGGCPYEYCNEIASTITSQNTFYGINYWFNSMHSTCNNYNYTNCVTWGKVYNAYNPKWIVNPAATAGSIGTNHSVCPGVTPNLLTSASNGTGVGTISYEWQSSPNGSTWTTISGATGATYQPPVITATTYYRRRTKSVAAATCYSAYTNTVTVTLNTTSTAPTSITVVSP